MHPMQRGLWICYPFLSVDWLFEDDQLSSNFFWNLPVLLALECRTVQFCVKSCADLQYFISVCLYFIFVIFHFIYLFLWSCTVYLFWSSTTLEHSFNMICSFLLWSLSALLFQHFCSAWSTLLSLSVICFSSFSILSFCLLVVWLLHLLLTVQVVLSWSYWLILLLILSWIHWNYWLLHPQQV